MISRAQHLIHSTFACSRRQLSEAQCQLPVFKGSLLSQEEHQGLKSSKLFLSSTQTERLYTFVKQERTRRNFLSFFFKFCSFFFLFFFAPFLLSIHVLYRRKRYHYVCFIIICIFFFPINFNLEFMDLSLLSGLIYLLTD